MHRQVFVDFRTVDN